VKLSVKQASPGYRGLLERYNEIGVLLQSAFTVDDHGTVLVYTRRSFHHVWIAGVCRCLCMQGVGFAPPAHPGTGFSPSRRIVWVSQGWWLNNGPFGIPWTPQDPWGYP
jgi:hypothetical protein